MVMETATAIEESVPGSATAPPPAPSPTQISAPVPTKSPHIGTLNEKPLHEALKRWYARPGDLFEVPVDRFVVDIVRGDLLIEVQTRNFSSIKRKLELLSGDRSVRLVYPIPREKWIVKLAEEGDSPISRRRSPKRGGFEHVFEELVRLPELLGNPNFSLELLLIEEEEVRRYDGVRGWRRRGWVTEERRLLRVVETRALTSPADMHAFIPATLAEPFSVADLAAATRTSRTLAGKMEVREAIFYDDLDAQAYATGICVLHGNAFAKLWSICRAKRMTVVADLHTHDGVAIQSSSDRTSPMIARPGHIAIIVPNLARGPVSTKHLGIYEYCGCHEWIDRTATTAPGYFYMGIWS